MLKARILTAIILLLGFSAALFLLPDLGWLIFCAVVCGAAAWEWGGLAAFQPALRAVYATISALLCAWVGLGAGLAGGWGLHTFGIPALPATMSLLPFYLASVLFWLLCVPFWLARKWRFGSVGAAASVGLLVLLPPSLALAHLRLIDPWLLLCAMSFAWVADIVAFFVGRRFGRIKLAPAISPGKTREGAWGAIAGVMAYGLALGWVLLPAWRTPLALSMLALGLLMLTVLSIVGDLFESLLKRQAGLKDSGKLLPGHGGILDRIDSLTAILPPLALFFLYFAS